MISTVAVSKGAIKYKLTGQGPPLALVSTLSGTWMRQVPVLKRHFTVLTYDMRGFGGSPSANGLPTNAEHADDLAELLDALGIARVALAGLSHGGLVGQHFAIRHGDRLRGLALVATFAKARDSAQLFLRMLYGFLERDDLENFWQVLKSFLFTSVNADTMLRREAALRQAMFDQYTTSSLCNIYGQAIEHDAAAIGLGGVRCPTLVVGGEQDMLFPPPLTRELTDLVAGARLLLLPAAHIPPVEASRQFNDALTEFFKDSR
jgi:3-oxoadipate enol-lactonase